MINIVMLKYYVYAYIRLTSSKVGDIGSPYYIGKGSGKRAQCHTKRDIISHNNTNIVILESNLSELGAFALERRMIRWFGRVDNGTGILRNRTDGGEGASGRVQTKSEKDLRASKIKGTTRNKKQKENISLGRTGVLTVKRKCDFCNIICDSGNLEKSHNRNCMYNPANTERYLYKVSCIHCRKTIHKNNINRFHGDNCKSNPTNTHTKRTLSSEIKSKIKNKRQITKKKLCTNCNKLFDPGNYTKYHNNKCKSLIITHTGVIMYDNSFLQAVDHAMRFEVGPWWKLTSDVSAGLINTAEQRRNCGYVNEPSDKGGETKFGVAKNANLDLNIATLSWDQAKAVYYNRYWLAGSCDKLPARVAVLHFDCCVNHGVGRAGKFLQAALGVAVDGQVGPATIAAASAKDPIALCNSICDQRNAFYNAIVAHDSTQQKFMNGWLSRSNDLRAFTTNPTNNFQ